MKLQGGVINGPKNPQFVFRSTLTGEIRNEDAELTLNYVDAKEIPDSIWVSMPVL